MRLVLKYWETYNSSHGGVVGNLSETGVLIHSTEYMPPSLRGMFIIGLRDYIALGTQRGPDSSKLLTPRILTFTQP